MEVFQPKTAKWYYWKVRQWQYSASESLQYREGRSEYKAEADANSPERLEAKRRERKERQTAESNPSNQPTRIVRSILSSILWRTYNYALLSHNPNPLGPSWQTQIVWFTETNLLSRQVEDAEFSFTDKLGHDLSINKNEELLWINLDWYGNRISSSIQNINSLINIYAIYKYTKSC